MCQLSKLIMNRGEETVEEFSKYRWAEISVFIFTIQSQLTWLTEATKTILLIHTDTVHTRRGFTLVQAVLAEGTRKAGCTIATAMGNNAILS